MNKFHLCCFCLWLAVGAVFGSGCATATHIAVRADTRLVMQKTRPSAEGITECAWRFIGQFACGLGQSGFSFTP